MARDWTLLTCKMMMTMTIKGALATSVTMEMMMITMDSNNLKDRMMSTVRMNEGGRQALTGSKSTSMMSTMKTIMKDCSREVSLEVDPEDPLDYSPSKKAMIVV